MGFCAVSFWLGLTNGEPQQQGTEVRKERRSGHFGILCLQTSDSQPGDFIPKGTLGNVQRHFWFSQLEVLLATSG